jgi:hypothetical protein
MDPKELARREKEPLPLPGFSWRGSSLAAGSGVCATVALLVSPIGEQFPPIVLPYLPVDLRWVTLPALFVLMHAGVARSKWPRPALMLPALALLFAGIAHVQASAVLGFLGLEGSQPGERIDLLRGFLSGASLLLALAAMLDRSADRVGSIARRAGATSESVDALLTHAERQAERTLGFAGAAFVTFLLAARIGDTLVGGERAPLPEVVGVGVALMVALLLFPGLGRRAPVARP